MAEYYKKKQPSCTTPDGREWFASGGGNTNPEYIEREAVLKVLRGSAVAKYPMSFYTGLFAAAGEVEKMPAADVVPVVRCGECERRSKSADLTYTIYCPWIGQQMDKKDFCSYGERKDGDG